MGFFTIAVTIDGLERKFETLAELAEDLEAPLRVFGGYLLKKTKGRYKAQGFAPLAESTIEARARKGLHSLERKLSSDVRRAQGRARKSRGAPRGLLKQILGSSAVDRALEDALSASTKGVQNRIAVLAEFQNRRAHSWKGRLSDQANTKPLTVKQLASLGDREKRAIDKAVAKPILGGLDKTLGITVEGDTVTLKSTTHQTWSDAHNEGATVGNGAKLPERKTIFIEPVDLEVLGSILKDHHLIAFDESLQGPGY